LSFDWSRSLSRASSHSFGKNFPGINKKPIGIIRKLKRAKALSLARQVLVMAQTDQS
jgi:hypothetical protein